MADRWSTETHILVAAAIAGHVDLVRPDDRGNALLTCCGCDFTRTMPLNRDWGPFHAEFRAHRADAVLTALADAGLLHEPHTGPRTWQMPEIPPDLTRVRDNLGREWRFETEGRWAGSWVTSADEKPGWIAKAREENVRSLFLRWGPLTEVLPNGD